MTQRASVRGVIVSDDGRVLLAKWRRPTDGARFWLCPGGGIEEGEDDAAALARELAEETGLIDYELGPHVATWHWSNGYQHRFYVVRCARFEPAPGAGHPDYEVFDEYRWWSPDALSDCGSLAPHPQLSALLAAIAEGGLPDSIAEWRIDP